MNPNGLRIVNATQVNNRNQILVSQRKPDGSFAPALLDPTDAPLPVVAEVPTMQWPLLIVLSLLVAAGALPVQRLRQRSRR